MDDKVKKVVADVFNRHPETIPDDLKMTDMDAWDSLKHMELIVTLETAFSIQLTFDEIVKMQSVPEIKRVLEERGALS